MRFRKGYTIYTVLLSIFSLAVIITRKYLGGSELNIKVLLSLFSIILFLFSFYFLTPTYYWNSLLKERAMIEEFFEDNIDIKKLEMVAKKDELDDFAMYINDKLLSNGILINKQQIIESIENDKIEDIIENDKIKNKQKKLLIKSMNNYKNSVTLFTIIKMRYKIGYYSKNLNYTLFFTLLSLSVSVFALSSFEALKLYDNIDITFAISFTVVSIVSIVYDLFTWEDKARKMLIDTYDYLLHLKNKSLEEIIDY